MSTPSIATPAIGLRAGRVEEADRYADIKQYSLAQILAVWAAAALPMGILAWAVAPAIKDSFSGVGNIPLIKALLVVLTAGLIWQFVLVAVLVWFEQRSLRWSTVRESLWLRSPRSPRSGAVGGKLWLIVIPLIALFAIAEFLPAFGPENRDLVKFMDSAVGKSFMSGNWGWYALILALFVFNTVLGEELLFRGLLLPRMKRVFGRRDWVANGVLFTAYHLHVPWMMPATLLIDTFAVAYPARRYQSAWIGIAVHSSQSVVVGVVILGLVL
jgi:membrane protease YdiL (CAAX protease family)